LLFIKFQFHYGSVKRIVADSAEVRLIEFQFHYGSVKRRMNATTLKGLGYFNSTMVRLKVAGVPFNVYQVVKFQFHYGSVKRLKAYIVSEPRIKFQFHYGSVKRSLPIAQRFV